MVSLAYSIADELREQYHRHQDVDLPDFLRAHDPQEDDEIADIIETDGRCRIDLGLPVELARYLDVFPGLDSRPTALDAAIDMALRSIAGQARPTSDAVQTLLENYPSLAGAIRDAAVLGNAIFSTLGSRVSPPPRRDLPCPFGPLTRTGFARYTLDRVLGRGSSGTVYAATDRALSEPDRPAIVAIKVLARSAADVSGFVAEAGKARRVSHPNVATVLDCGIAPSGEPYIVHEYISGGDLQTTLDAPRQNFAPREAALLIIGISRGIHAAHMAGLVHRDLKPANILLADDGTPKVIDFDLAARLGDADAQLHAGNPVFVAPEQFRLDPRGITTAADIYALGGILFHLLTRQWPNGHTLDEIARTHDPEHGRQAAPSLRALTPGVDADLDAICRRALAPRPADRHQSAAAFADDLERWLAHEPIHWRRPSPTRKLHLVIRRRPIAMALIAFASISGASALAFAYIAKAKEARFVSLELDAARSRAEAAASQGISQNYEKQHEAMTAVLNGMQWNFNPATFYGMSQSLLLESYYIELLASPQMLDDPDSILANWRNRVAIARARLDDLQQRGDGAGYDAGILKYLMGYWQIETFDAAQAARTLDGAQAHWLAIAPQDDAFHARIAALKQAAEVLKFVDDPAVEDLGDGRLERVQSLIDTASQLHTNHGPSPAHRLCLRILRQARYIASDELAFLPSLDNAITGLREYKDPQADEPYKPARISRRGRAQSSIAPN